MFPGFAGALEELVVAAVTYTVEDKTVTCARTCLQAKGV
jgi:hypothetical protein